MKWDYFRSENMPAEVMMTTIPVTVLRSDSLTDLNNGAAGGGDSSCSGSGGEGDDPESGFSRGEQERQVRVKSNRSVYVYL